MRGLALVAVTVLCSAATAAAGSAKPKNAILLSEVQSLTLHANKPTTHRRVSAIPQLRCVSKPTLCALADIQTLRCVNQGASYGAEDIEWACTASLPATVKLGATEVICEGYSSPDDPYVLRGSCGVEYRVALTPEGERLNPNLGGGGGEESPWPGYIFGVIFFSVLAWIIYSACVQGGGVAPGAAPRAAGRRWGGGGGGGGGGWGPGWGPGGDAPPPYPGTKPAGADEAWRPGFWSGLAGGAAAGYMAGNRGRRDQDYDRRGNIWGGGRDYGSGWGSSSGSRASGSSSSGSQHESTGFGSTSRR
ncbi:hypothetical protein B0H67DRAFT_646856 [Lasiosphaeris hirsuta]|uniref:Store-operated calcium entry-associated regulatory factor n=1 Tax=Lasiosphaeris hirsuta TaxID=260670 RepID=A0AA40A8X7_9PEZI|nr:hypothetical protein B0H67DRAFT_646856 [Lasiosphaeris hirsuta]